MKKLKYDDQQQNETLSTGHSAEYIPLPQSGIDGNAMSPFCAVYFLLIMVALCNRANHYIFAVISIFLFFSSPNLSGRRLDVYHTSTHGVALVQI